MNRAFTELIVVHGLTNHVSSATNTCGASMNPVLSDLPGHSVVCSYLQRKGTSDHNAVLSEVGLNSAHEEDR